MWLRLRPAPDRIRAPWTRVKVPEPTGANNLAVRGPGSPGLPLDSRIRVGTLAGNTMILDEESEKALNQ